MSRRVAVTGVGQSTQAKRREVSIGAMVREAVTEAMADAALEFADIDAVVLSKTPDLFDGVMNPELYLADAMGAVGLPVTRVFTGGSVGGHAAIFGAHLVQAGLAERVLVVAYSKESEGNFTWALSRGLPFSAPLGAGAGGHFAPVIREYIRRSGAPEHIGWQVAVNHRLNAVRNPYAHVHRPDITVEEVRDSRMLWDPIRYLESCPSSDGSCAIVVTGEEHAGHTPRPPAWIHGMAWRTETGHFAGRDEVNPVAGQQCAADAYRQAGIDDPAAQVDARRAIGHAMGGASQFHALWVVGSARPGAA